MENAIGGQRKVKGKGRALPFFSKGARCLFYLCLLLSALLLSFTFSACRNRALLDEAQQAFESGDYEGATNRYEEFLKQNPTHDQAGNAHFQAGNIYLFNLKQYDKAVTHYIQFIEGSPRSPNLLPARQRLAKSYAGMGKRREAISEYENLLIAFPDQVDKRRVRLDIADLYFDQNDLRQARTEYQKVTRDAAYDSLAERADLQIGNISVLLGDFEDAIPVYQAVVRQSPDKEIRRRASLLLADCYQRTLQYEEAIKVLEQTEPDPKAPDEIKRRIAAVRETQKQRGL
ncbi:MAG: tetratricopeptide repeat protein [Blastocatellia bacterium]